MNPRNNDVLASNLLFATLLILLCDYALILLGDYIISLRAFHFYSDDPPIITSSQGQLVAAMVMSLLVRGGVYYGIRRGMLAAKLMLALGFVFWVVTNTHWQSGYVAGIDFASIKDYALLTLLKDLLLLAALVLMFTKPRVPAS